MMIKYCKECGKPFEGTGTSAYCNGPHYRKCEVCGKEFLWDHKNPKRCCSSKCSFKLGQLATNKLKKCELCGELFQPEHNCQRYCKKDHFRPCPVCGKPVKVEYAYAELKCCSQECTTLLRKQTCMSKYGVSVASQAIEVREKLRNASLDSADHRRETCIERWGVDNPAKNKDVRNKIAKTVRSKACQDKIKHTNMIKYGCEHIMQCELGLSKYSETIQHKYGVPYYVMTDDCRASGKHIISTINKKFSEFLSQNNVSYVQEKRVGNYSYDFYLLNMNILVEINPTYTHNTIGNHWGPGLDPNYHRDKTQFAVDNGYRCINVWDWDNWNNILMLISDKNRVYARKCKLSYIDAVTAKQFESVNHIQGPVNMQKVCIGLYHEDELVQVMTFGKPRYNKNFEWELLRLCSKSDTLVVGGAERLWSEFLRTYHPTSIISYCDLSKFSGNVYHRLGMTLDTIIEPNKIWSKGSKMITHNLLLSKGYDQLFGTSYGKGTSNEELMLLNGWFPVYDCGQARYKYFRDTSVL